MRNLFAAILAACVLTPATAEDAILRNGEDWIRLSDSACVHAGTLALIKPEFREQFKKARAMVGKQDFYAIEVSRFKPDGV